MIASNKSKYIPTKKAAAILGVSDVTVRRYIADGRLPWRLQDTRRRLVAEDAVKALKDSWNNPMQQSTA